MRRTIRFSYSDGDEGDLSAELSGDEKHLIITSGNSQQRYDGDEDTYAFDEAEAAEFIEDLALLLSKIAANNKKG